VLLHGVGLDRTMWDPFAEAWRALDAAEGSDPRAPQSIHLYAYDLVGLGEAPKPPGPYTLGTYVDQFAAEIETLTPPPDGADERRVDVVGFSMGALIAQRIAIDRPDLVRRLVLVAGVYDRTPEERASIVERVAQVRAGGYEATIEPAIERWFSPTFATQHPKEVGQVRDRMRANGSDQERLAAYANAYEVFATGDAELVTDVERITAPTLAIAGSDDQRSTAAMAHALADRIPGARSEILDQVRHMVPVEAASALAAMVRAFLTETAGPNLSPS
jgi:(E)-2-((N-methylformamido)methylene)succinate hydrolase